MMAAAQPSIRDALPDAMVNSHRWLLWRAEPNNKAPNRPRKVPYYASGERRSGTLDTDADRARLVDFATAQQALATGRYTGLGFALGPDGSGNCWQGIDLDHVDQNELTNLVADLPGYVERSPSGDGVHAIGIGKNFKSAKSNALGIECYSAGRYFTVTGHAIGGDIEDLSAFVANVLMPKIQPGYKQSASKKPSAGESFFAKVNSKAMQSLSAWVPALFPMAREYNDGYRISSADLGRTLEEDISILPKGARDFGEERGTSPINLVIEWGPASDAKDAALWLCERMSIDPGSLGWNVVPMRRKHPGQVDDAQDKPAVSENIQPENTRQHFQPLGYDGDQFYFMTARGQQVRALSASKVGKKTELMTLAPLEWWEREFSDDDGFSGRAVDLASNFLIQQCLEAGVFSMDRRRGRGVWRDGERVVIHAGDRLYIDGQASPLINAGTEYVYERQPALRLQLGSAMCTDESRQLIDLMGASPFESQTTGRLFAGWIVIAILSGALPWRPHGILSGGKGSGKTTLLNVTAKLLGPFGLSVTGGTTEAGLRQSLKMDALPVLFDEAEGDSQKSAQNIDAVLAMMRSASAGQDAKVIKGGSDGKANVSVIQSCFLLAAIRDQVTQAADQSRITSFALRQPERGDIDRFRDTVLPKIQAITTPEWCARFQARVLRLSPMILQAVDVFRAATGAFFSDARMGDQIGTLLAGVWSLEHDQIPTESDAIGELDTWKWDAQSEVLENASDEAACLRAILEYPIKVDSESGWHGEISIGDAVALVAGNRPAALPLGISSPDAERSIGMYGLRVHDGHLLVSNTNGVLGRKVMAHTSWPKGWGKILARYPGAVKYPKPVKIQGATTRVVGVPINAL